MKINSYNNSYKESRIWKTWFSELDSNWKMLLRLQNNNTIKQNDIDRLKHMRVMYIAPETKITNLNPLQQLINLESICFDNNESNDVIFDLTPLSNLYNLKTIFLSYNNINDLTPLQNLINLKYLGLENNNISDLSPLSGLYNLKELYLNYNVLLNKSSLKILEPINIEKLYL